MGPSVLLERYVQEADSDIAKGHLLADTVWVTASICGKQQPPREHWPSRCSAPEVQR
jgi:hypothetical protein